MSGSVSHPVVTDGTGRVTERHDGRRPVTAERGRPHGTGLGTFRRVVERTISWLHGYRRLRIRWERRDNLHKAFLGLVVCLITHRHVQRLCQGQ
jgi:hypothetical protein